jgi:hypothetical protein
LPLATWMNRFRDNHDALVWCNNRCGIWSEISVEPSGFCV